MNEPSPQGRSMEEGLPVCTYFHSSIEGVWRKNRLIFYGVMSQFDRPITPKKSLKKKCYGVSPTTEGSILTYIVIPLWHTTR
jgi:hypothetical protein